MFYITALLLHYPKRRVPPGHPAEIRTGDFPLNNDTPQHKNEQETRRAKHNYLWQKIRRVESVAQSKRGRKGTGRWWCGALSSGEIFYTFYKYNNTTAAYQGI